MERFDAVVVGGGPSGCAFTLTLARAGGSVAVVERSSPPGPRAGDVLPPEARPVLDALGVWDRFRSDGHHPSPGTISVWGSPEPAERDWISSPWGSGWHVDRARFDAGLREAAEEAGATVHRGARVTAVRQADGAWQVDATSDGGDGRRLVADFLVEATGRASSLTRLPAGRRAVFDRLVAVVATVDGGTDRAGTDGRLLVEASENGWWYSARFPDDRLVVAWMTDPDATGHDAAPLRERWGRELARAAWTRARVPRPEAAAPRAVAAATSSRRAARGRWIAVGDAAASYDPLSGQGVLRALTTGRAAADALVASRGGAGRALDDYADTVAGEFRGYLQLRGEYYRAERRWPTSVFWQRRHLAPPAPSGAVPADPSPTIAR